MKLSVQCEYMQLLEVVIRGKTCTKGLVTNYGEGGATKREGGHVKFYPYEKRGQKKF